jgi:hypothetical protein
MSSRDFFAIEGAPPGGGVGPGPASVAVTSLKVTSYEPSTPRPAVASGPPSGEPPSAPPSVLVALGSMVTTEPPHAARAATGTATTSARRRAEAMRMMRAPGATTVPPANLREK